MTTHADKMTKCKTESGDRTGIRHRNSSGFRFHDNRAGISTQQKLEQIANSSPRVGQLMRLQNIANGESATQVIQLEKLNKKTKIRYAESEMEATLLMRKYAENIGLEWEQLPKNLRDLSIRHAQDKEEFGIDSAEGLIFGEKASIDDARKKRERSDLVKDDFAEILEELEDNSLVRTAFETAHSTYIGGATVNTGISGAYSEATYWTAKREWDDIENRSTIRGFRSHAPQDKAALGKGNVGATMDTRKVQGNLFCKFGNVEINVHVNIE